jgi:hypothetical protein
MFDEDTPEIQEPEYQEDDGRHPFIAGGEETTEQVVASWFQDDPTDGPMIVVPDDQDATEVADTTDVTDVTEVTDATDVQPTSVDPAVPAPELTFNEPGPTDQSVQQVPTNQSVLQVPTDQSLQPAPVFDQDMTGWTDNSTPQDWVDWTSPTDPGQDSLTADWGQVQADWPQEGQDLWTQSPPQTSLSDVVGPGHVADQYWGNQGQTNYCVLYSAASILGEVYGHPIDMNEMVNRAEANHWLVHNPDGSVLGVNPENFDDLLASYGVASHNVDGEGEQAALEDLNTALTNNQRVIVSLDSKEIDAQANLGTDADADHAVAVTGIDYSRGVVILNDSARSAGLEVPLQVFVDAWRDGSFHMTVTDNSLGAGEGAIPPQGTAGVLPDAPEFAVLPFTLHLPSDAPTLPEPRTA